MIQACEVSLNEKTFDLEVRPRDIEPRLEADCYAEMELPGIKQLEAFWRSSLATGANRANPFEPSTYEGTLKAAVGYLDPSGSYEVRTEDVVPPPPEDNLKLTNTWVLFGRKRSGDIFLEDIRRLKKEMQNAATLPSVVRSFVERGDSEVRVKPEQPFRGLSTSDGGTGALELFFPLPYNDEQVSIVQKLHANDGVVVQGPPGTGKTHTIANVICHYLAQGKRVLVTAKGESALAVLQEKLPEGVRPLSVSLLSDERDGMKQFEHSIQTIASRVAAINPVRLVACIAAAEEKLSQLHAKIAHVDRTVASYASNHMRNYSFHGRDVTPEEMAKLVLEHAETHQWFDDEPPATKDGVLPFDDAAVGALRRARLAVRGDLCYVECKLPSPEEFPAWADILALHRDLVKAKAIDESVTQGAIFPLADSSLETFEKAQSLVAFLEERIALKGKIAAARQPWLDALETRLADTQPNDPTLQALSEVLVEVRALEHQRRELVAKGVEVPVDAELNTDFCEGVGRLIEGRSAFALPFGKGDARKILACVTVTGVPPASNVDWKLVRDKMTWRTAVRKVLARWTSLSGEFGLPTPEAGVEAGFRKIALWQVAVEDARQLTFEYDAQMHSRLQQVFGSATAARMWDGGERFVASAFTSLQAHVDKGRLAYAMRRLQEIVQKLDGCRGDIVTKLRRFLTESVGQPVGDESVLQTSWSVLQLELRRLTALRPHLDEIARVADMIEGAGATKWAKRLRAEPARR